MTDTWLLLATPRNSKVTSRVLESVKTEFRTVGDFGLNEDMVALIFKETATLGAKEPWLL